MTSAVDGALDLSAKSQDDHDLQVKREQASAGSTGSPVPSVSSETESHGDRSSVSSQPEDDRDVRDHHSVHVGGTVRPVPGPMPTSPHLPALGEDSEDMQGSPAGRPFKMYPFDAASSSVFPTPSPIGPPTPSMAGGAGFTPFGGALSGPIGFSPVDIGAMALSSPITSYLLNRKQRRTDNKQDCTPNHTATGTLKMESDGEDSKRPRKDELKDDAYWERRRKNNEAAKRSRDARRAKEEEIAFRAAILEQENLKLRAQVAILKNETQKLHMLLYQRM